MLWKKQVENLIKLGFHEAAGLSELELRSYILPPKRESALLIVSEKCLNIAKQCELLEIKNNIFLDHHFNKAEVPPTFFYWRYDVDDGRTTKGVPTHVALEQFRNKNRLPAITAEILAIYRENPDVIKVSHFIDALGSEVCKGDDLASTPTLLLDGEIDLKRKMPQLKIYCRVDTDKEKGYELWGAASVAPE